MNLVERFQTAYGKSQAGLTYVGPLLLHDHVMDVTRVVVHVLRNSRPSEYPARRADALVLAGYLHDIGKLDENFKEMLRRVHNKQSLEGLPRVKHEASTFDFVPQVTPADLEAVAAAIAEVTDYRIDPAHLRDEAILADVWAHAVTHHGLFYVSTEVHNGKERRCIRRQWTAFYAGERSRLTLADLLFEYHPLGGLVIVGDIIASAWHGMRQPIEGVLQQYATLEQFINVVQQREVFEEAAAQQRKDEGRDTHLGDMIGLLLGGVK
jgi:uncharacterized protein (DUF2267 family)